ncbi:MAG: hypothetical protein K0U21_08730 [Proteobacteria bacterium]|nr:hypothetical protein [Pseudomonadota bacterium]
MKINQERINELKSFALEAGNEDASWHEIKHKANALRPKRDELIELEKQLQKEQEDNSKNKESLLNAQKHIEDELGEALLISDYVLAGKKIAELRAQQEVVSMRLEALNATPEHSVQPLWQSLKASAALKALSEKEPVFSKKLEELTVLMMELNYLASTADTAFKGASTFGYVSNNLPKPTAQKTVDLTGYY